MTALTAAVDAGAEATVARLTALVRHATSNPPGDTAAAIAWLHDDLTAAGLTVETHPVPEPFCRPHHRTNVTNLVVREVFGPGPTVALHAPIDTLPIGATHAWHHEPLGAKIKDGRLYGRGARDSKADLAAFIGAVLALKATGAARGTVELHVTADEEAGGFLGPAFLLGHGLVAPDRVIAAGTSYQVIVGQQGVLHMEVVVRGRQAHASRPGDGADAVAALGAILNALAAEPVTVSTVAAGRGVNLVADKARLTLDRRFTADETGDAIEAALATTIAAASPGNVTTECRRLLLADPVVPTPASEALATTIAEAAGAVFGTAIPVVSAPVASGARHYAAAGIPTALYGVGPPTVGEGADSDVDECVALDDLRNATEAVARAVTALTAT
ncbi:MAG: M20/M25/M40 family metallo-hydrolase [Pseudomonadota bacterium]